MVQERGMTEHQLGDYSKLWENQKQNYKQTALQTLSGKRKFMNHKEICTVRTSMPGIVTTPVGLKIWTKIFGKPSME